jgi:hypothetical protein
MEFKLKEKLASLYIRYWLIPKIEDITHRGFVITKLTGEDTDFLLRDVFLPEDLFVEIENKFGSNYGDTGVKALYSAGKKGGYAYAGLSNLLTRSNADDKKFKNFVWGLLQFIGGTYASEVSLDIDVKNKKIEEVFKNLIICEKNGRGHIISEGGLAGICSYLFEDTSIEGVQTSCQGRGDDSCILVAQPYNAFEIPPKFKVNDLPKVEYTEDFIEFNKVRETEYCKSSLEELVNNKFFDYADGLVISKGMRHFELDPHIVYILEEECKKLDGGSNLLFQTAFDTGVKIVDAAQNNSPLFIMDYLSALGWGDILVLNDKNKAEFSSSFHPWTVYSSTSDYTIFRGLISGMMSCQLKKEIKFNNVETDFSQGYLTIFSKVDIE